MSLKKIGNHHPINPSSLGSGGVWILRGIPINCSRAEISRFPTLELGGGCELDSLQVHGDKMQTTIGIKFHFFCKSLGKSAL